MQCEPPITAGGYSYVWISQLLASYYLQPKELNALSRLIIKLPALRLKSVWLFTRQHHVTFHVCCCSLGRAIAGAMPQVFIALRLLV